MWGESVGPLLCGKRILFGSLAPLLDLNGSGGGGGGGGGLMFDSIQFAVPIFTGRVWLIKKVFRLVG